MEWTWLSPAPGQARNLSEMLDGKVQVCDRTMLILDIFSQRARTAEVGSEVPVDPSSSHVRSRHRVDPTAGVRALRRMNLRVWFPEYEYKRLEECMVSKFLFFLSQLVITTCVALFNCCFVRALPPPRASYRLRWRSSSISSRG